MRSKILVCVAVGVLLAPAAAFGDKPPLIFPFAPAPVVDQQVRLWRIECGYGCNLHTGQDAFAIDFNIQGDHDRGLPILAAADGVVDAVGERVDYGHYIDLDHGDRYVSRYAHLNEAPTLIAGSRVLQGQQIGKCGDSGIATGVHLHFALYRRSGQVLSAELPEPMSGFEDLTQFETYGVSATLTTISETPPFYPGDVVSGGFTITNHSSLALAPNLVTISGRGPAGPNHVVDFPMHSGSTMNPNESFAYQDARALPASGLYRFSAAYQVDGIWYSIPLADGALNRIAPTVSWNLALGKSCYVWTNGVEGPSGGHPGEWPGDVVDGSLFYEPVSSGREDGCIAWQNPDYNELMRVHVLIDLGQTATVTRVRYNMGNCERAATWGADWFISPLDESPTNPGGSFNGAWTAHEGSFEDRSINCFFDKTRVNTVTDWLFIGEVEAYGISDAAQSVLVAVVTGPNNAHGDPFSALGSPDSVFLSLGVAGHVALDIGQLVPDGPGDDVRIVASEDEATKVAEKPLPAISRSSSVDGYEVMGSIDGFVWTSLGSGVGTGTFDMAAGGLMELRYVRIVDDGGGDSLSTAPGFDLDAVLTEWSDPIVIAVDSPVPTTPFFLGEAFPNPFHGQTALGYAVPSAGDYTFRVFNVHGRVVWQSTITAIAPTSGVLRWEGTDASGRRVGSGAYYIQFVGPGIVQTRRVVLLR